MVRGHLGSIEGYMCCVSSSLFNEFIFLKKHLSNNIQKYLKSKKVHIFIKMIIFLHQFFVTLGKRV